MTTVAQRLDLPADSDNLTHQQLAYLEVRDAPLNLTYAFLAYRESDRSDGRSCIRIRSSQTTGVVFEPAMMLDRAMVAGDHDRPYFTWGAGIEPSNADPRLIEYRVHIADSRPHEIEIVARMRRADHSPGELKSVRFPWNA